MVNIVQRLCLNALNKEVNEFGLIAAIWHCLNHYDYCDAIFLSERLYAEVKTDDSLFLLATAYYRNGQIDHAYNVLKDKMGSSTQCRYLLSRCAFEMQKYSEAETALSEHSFATCNANNNNIDDLVTEYEDQASFVLLLLAKISVKTGRTQQALECYKRALKLNPFLWSSFESMCDMGERPNPNTYFQLSELENLSHCHGNSVNNIESVIIGGNGLVPECSPAISTPQQQILMTYSSTNNNSNNTTSPKVFAREESPLVTSLCMSGVSLLNTRSSKHVRMKIIDNLNASSTEHTPSFGHILDYAEDFVSTPNAAQANEQKSFTKKMRAHMGNLISRKEGLLQNSKPVFSQTSVNNSMTPNTPASVSTGPIVRRSSRLFSNSNSVKENNKSPNRNKFVTPKSPSRKTKQRLAKCNLNDFNSYLDNKSRLKKEQAETVTSNVSVGVEGVRNAMGEGVQLQKQSAEGLMCLLREIGSAYSNLARFNCKAAIEEFQQLPAHQFETSWVYCMLGLAYFELADYENSVKYFGEVHSREPFRIKYMDVYSTALWHLQKEVALSALAQDLVLSNKNSPITWIVNGNCFSLHKEHDTAIRFLHRAVQVDPNFPYAYTLLGHEYITTEELDKAMSCYRNAIRLDSRHYNAWFGIGTIYAKQERFQLALMNYNRALSINPHNSVILCHIGVVQQALKKTDKALATFNTAIAKDPKNALCKFHRASIYFAVNRHAEALKELEELKQIIPKESLLYYLIGKVHKKLGNTDLALMHFSWATDLDPKGASSQIKEAFDPAVGRSGDDDSFLTPEREPHTDSGVYQHPTVLFTQDDSDDSL